MEEVYYSVNSKKILDSAAEIYIEIPILLKFIHLFFIIHIHNDNFLQLIN